MDVRYCTLGRFGKNSSLEEIGTFERGIGEGVTDGYMKDRGGPRDTNKRVILG